MNKSTKYFFLVLILLASCAQQRGLSGGEKDNIPPVVISYSPQIGTTRFDERQFVIEFDEYVQLNSISQELIISPPLKKAPKVKVRQHSIVVSWQEELIPNTTYVFNFGNGVTDVNEANKAQDLRYVFSTGDAIDSLEIKGQVQDAFIDQPAKAIKVIAYTQDTMIFSKKPQPSYFTRTKEDGTFVLDFMHDGEYFLYALDDINGNYRYDKGEAFSFLDSIAHPMLKDSIGTQMHISIPRLEVPVVNDYKTDSTGLLSFPWDRYFTAYSVRSLNAIPLMISDSTLQDTVEVRLQGKPTDKYESLVVEWKNSFSDTVLIPFFKEAQEIPFRLEENIDQKIIVGHRFDITAKAAIQIRDAANIKLVQDSVAIPAELIPNENSFGIRAKLLQGKKYELTILPGAFENATGTTNDTLKTTFTTYKNDELGELIFTLNFDPELEKNVFTLKNKEGKIIYSERNVKPGLLSIKGLAPGEYAAEMLYDENQNGIFDPAVIESNKQPERNYILPGKLNVRSNWQLKQDWDIRKK